MDPLQSLTETLFDTVSRIDDNRRGHVVAELTLFTILIDAGLLTIEKACERLELVRSSLGESYQTDQTKLRTQLLVDWLRAHEVPDTKGWDPVVIDGGKDQD